MTNGDLERINKIITLCDDCKFATCEQCEINYGDVFAIKHLYEENQKLKNQAILAAKGFEETLTRLDKIIEILLREKIITLYDFDDITEQELYRKYEEKAIKLLEEEHGN